jgi:hypothetical protein
MKTALEKRFTLIQNFHEKKMSESSGEASKENLMAIISADFVETVDKARANVTLLLLLMSLLR